MRVAVMAAGAVGGYFGARLAAAGHEVAFIARGAHLAAIRERGLKIESVRGDLHLKDVQATSDPADVGAVDIVLFAVKLWDTEIAAQAARPLVGPATRVITLQNGVGSVERVVPILGDDHVVGGTAYIATVVAAPGVIRHTSQFAGMRCGRIDGRDDPQLAAFADAARAADIDITVSSKINLDRWQKFVFLVGLSSVTAASRKPLGPVLADDETRSWLVDLMGEVMAVGRAKGVTFPPGFLEDQIKFAHTTPYDFKASMLHDLEAGRRLELDWLAGKVTKLGRELGVPTPANEAVYKMLKLSRMGG
jgi:2-dehydropantoate 2-reductase